MKIVNITGGLGNQMFQYAFAMSLQKKYPADDVRIDTHHYQRLFFKKFRGVNLHNGFELDKVFPKATISKATPRQVIKYSYYVPNYVLSRIVRRVFPVRKTEYVAPYLKNYCYDTSALSRVGDCYYEGYWQSFKYYEDIREELLDVYSHSEPSAYNRDIIKDMESCNSVGIHVRRGDYLSEPEFKGICDTNYYKEGIKEILKDGKPHVFYVFSNDIAWCKDNIGPMIDGNSHMVFVTGNTGKNSCWDMFLMTHCKDLIIANSSFSWWGAFLNRNVNKVICPSPWLNRDCSIEIYNPDWIQLH